jgi:hypothetical protein
MASIAEQLIGLAKSVEPPDGFGGYFDLVDALEASPSILAHFKAALASAKAEELESIDDLDLKYARLVMGAADAMDLCPTTHAFSFPPPMQSLFPMTRCLIRSVRLAS